jgi:hypothetical protein
MVIRAKLEAMRGTGEIVRVFREQLEDGWVDGFVAGCGPEIFALQIFDSSGRLNGINVMRFKDVTNLIAPAPYSEFLRKALTVRGEKANKLQPIDLSSFHGLLEGLQRQESIVTIHPEESEDDCTIGRIHSLNQNLVELLTIDPNANWNNEPESITLDKITRVDFGGYYEESLLLVAGLGTSTERLQ